MIILSAHYRYISLKTGVFTSLFWVMALLAGCQATVPTEEVAGSSARETLSPLPQLPIQGAVHYTVDSGQSEIRILVFRGGPLARFGHNHILLAKKVIGDIYLAPELYDSAFILGFPVRQLDIDPVDARNEEGEEFAIQPSPEAIEGTRKNMLGPEVLDADRYPDITIRSVRLVGPASRPEITVQITLHGVTREVTVPTALEQAQDSMTVTGMLTLRTSDFNMTPFSILNGGLRVQDEVKVRFHITAVNAQNNSGNT